MNSHVLSGLPSAPRGVTAETLTAAVQASFAVGAQSPRLAALLRLLVQHLHAFVREGAVTHEEWRAGLAFLTACGRITTAERNEFSLLSDILGVSSMVDLLTHQPGVTPGSVLGPFHNHDSRVVPNGADLIRGQEGDATLFTGAVTDVQGKPVAGAEIDFWQNAANAFYPAQDAAQDPHNLRCKMQCDDSGRFVIKTVRPQPYTVPYDGPVGAVLTATERHCWRPAHFHLIVRAAGYRSLVTEIFAADDPYIESDAVFGVRPGLAICFETIDDVKAAAEHGLPVPFVQAKFQIRLAAGSVIGQNVGE